MTIRVAGLPLAQLTQEQAALYHAIADGPRAGGAFPLVDADGCLRGPFNAMLLSPPIGQALQEVGAAVRYRSALSDRAREMAILVVAAHWGSRFERDAHEAVGRVSGLTDAEMHSLRHQSVPDTADGPERAAVLAAAALSRNAALTDGQYDDAVKALGERGLFELTTLVGYYATLALQLRVFAGEYKE